jgi:hypothetical protein
VFVGVLVGGSGEFVGVFVGVSVGGTAECVAVYVGVSVGTKAVLVGVLVGKAVLVGVGVDAAPSTVKCPTRSRPGVHAPVTVTVLGPAVAPAGTV